MRECCPSRSLFLFVQLRKQSFLLFIKFVWAWKKSVNEDLSLLIRISSPKLHSAPLNVRFGSEILHRELVCYSELVPLHEQFIASDFIFSTFQFYQFLSKWTHIFFKQWIIYSAASVFVTCGSECCEQQKHGWTNKTWMSEASGHFWKAPLVL